ncbi:MAG: NAD-dependent epimerase/dehydratase family protein [Planctomycetota bacterium]
MKILLTGASGYLGGHVLHALKEAGHEVRAVDSTRRAIWNGSGPMQTRS